MVLNKKEDCVFCKIASGEIPCYKIYETGEVVAFLDINPYAKGHVLVIPKNHSDWVWDMNLKEYDVLTKEVFYLACVLKKAFQTDWVEQVIAGIGVQHSHIHLMPRKKDDGLEIVPTKPILPEPTEKEMKEICEKIKSCL